MKLIPINPEDLHPEFRTDPGCREFLPHQIAYYEKIGFHPPWIQYFARLNGNWVGTVSFKGPPFSGKVEIAYATFPPMEGKGIGTRMCTEIVKLAKMENPEILITARTLPEENASTHILQKNGFHLQGPVQDPEDGTVWEWVFPLA